MTDAARETFVGARDAGVAVETPGGSRRWVRLVAR
jgi:hypothetical protein